MLALLDRNDRWHGLCAEAFKTIPLPLATSAAVLAERTAARRRPDGLSLGWTSSLSPCRRLAHRHVRKAARLHGCSWRKSGSVCAEQHLHAPHMR
jgi:hypothetical protein